MKTVSTRSVLFVSMLLVFTTAVAIHAEEPFKGTAADIEKGMQTLDIPLLEKTAAYCAEMAKKNPKDYRAPYYGAKAHFAITDCLDIKSSDEFDQSGKSDEHLDTALDMISKHDVHALIVVIFMPLKGTKMENVSPPPVRDVEAFLIRSRMQMPETRILLGCARPGGTYKKEWDKRARETGINGIAYPAEGIIEESAIIGPLLYSKIYFSIAQQSKMTDKLILYHGVSNEYL